MDQEHATPIYRRSEEFKKGWTKAFYDCHSDEGRRDGATTVERDPEHGHTEEERGYLCGLLDRRVELYPMSPVVVPERRRARAA